MRAVVVILVVAGLAGCNCASLRDDLVFRCESSSECDGGACVGGVCTSPLVDAGFDAGVDAGESDAGTPDAGADAGEPDAGYIDAGPYVETFGTSTDYPLATDYFGNGTTELGYIRFSTGTWYIKRAGAPMSTLRTATWGNPGDVPFVADVQDHGYPQIIQYRPTTSTFYGVDWFVTAQVTSIGFGSPGDIPLVGNFVGNRAADYAMYSPDSGTLRVLDSQRIFEPPWVFELEAGRWRQTLLTGPFLGNGREQIASWTAADGGTWTILDISPDGGTDGTIDGGYLYTYYLGGTGKGAEPYAFRFFDPARADLAIFENGTLYIQSTGMDASVAITFGESGDQLFVGDFFDAGTRQIAAFRPTTGEWLIRLPPSDGGY